MLENGFKLMMQKNADRLTLKVGSSKGNGRTFAGKQKEEIIAQLTKEISKNPSYREQNVSIALPNGDICYSWQEALSFIRTCPLDELIQ